MQIAFNVHKELVGTNYKMRFPVQKQCNYVSGDLLADNIDAEVQRTIITAQKMLRTNNIVIVE